MASSLQLNLLLIDAIENLFYFEYLIRYAIHVIHWPYRNVATNTNQSSLSFIYLFVSFLAMNSTLHALKRR